MVHGEACMVTAQTAKVLCTMNRITARSADSGWIGEMVTMLKKKYYDGFTVHDILNKHLDDGHKILELLTAFADADGVDAVEVIRCKDCKWWKAEKEECIEWYDSPYAPADGYCFRAERREDA